MIGVTLVRSLLRFIFLMCFESSSQGLVYDMREEAYRKLMKEDFNFFNKNRTGDLMSRQTGDMDAVRHMVSHVIYFSFENILVFLMALVMIFSVNVTANVNGSTISIQSAILTLIEKIITSAIKNTRIFSKLK